MVSGIVAAVSFLFQPLQAALQMDSTRAGTPPFGSLVWLFPVPALLLAGSVVWFSGRIQALCGMGRRGRLMVLAGFLLFLFLPILLAARVIHFRGRLADNFSSYGDLRAAQPDVFTPLFRQGISEIKQGREAEALDLLRRAAQARPFLFRYLLGPCRLSDLRWITGPSDLRGWVRQVGEERIRAAGMLTPQDRQILQEIQGEISDYGLCLFSIAQLEQRAGRSEQSRIWLSQMRYLERDPERLAAWMGPLPVVPEDPLPWRMDDYGFGRFLVRLWTGWDIRSTWDKQTGIAI